MEKKRLTKTLWYGSDVDSEGKPVVPNIASNDDSLSGINEGELYIHNHPDNPSLYTRTSDGKVVSVGGSSDGELGRHYIRKDKDDETAYKVSFGGGIEIGNYVAGMLGGSGAKIDKEGRAEFTSVTIREFLEVPELRNNRADVISGILWNAPAFGLIESVDTSRHTCTLKLEEGELSGLRTMDICMGIFSDFGEGSATTDGVDDNGFPTMVGFSTSYFTPIEIIKNQKGVCQFRYQLQEGTSVHPCKSMKFAVYGNFVDETRQASAYATRTYKRYISGVNTWKIDPDKNVYAQFGLLDGLTIGGVEMSGYGSYQHNCYLSGALIRFTPQQKEELKGESAYSVVLSDYEGIAVLNEDGVLVGGDMQTMNVVTDGKNVVTSGKNVVTSVYRLKTHVQAMRGTTQLHYALTTEEDGYTIALKPTGCKASVINGMIAVTSVEDANNAYVRISVNCEGKATFVQNYYITTVADGESVLALNVSSQTVTRNSLGTYEPSSLLVRSVKGTKERSMFMKMFAKDSDGKYKALDMSKYKNPASQWNVDLMALDRTDYKSIVFRSYKDTLEGKTYESAFDAEATVNFVDNGEAGPMPRNRGQYKASEAYAYNDEYRDYVWHNENGVTNVYIRKTKYETSEGCELGFIKGVDVSDSDFWEVAEKSALTAIDTALIDNANIAGFIFHQNGLDGEGRPTGRLLSQNEKIILDAKNGKLTCIDADMDGNIKVGSIRYKTNTVGGSMDGTSFGLGGQTYTLPVLGRGENMEIKLLYPRVDSKLPSSLFMVEVDHRYMSNGSESGKASIVVPDEENAWAKISTSAILMENIIYNMFGFCDSSGYTTWYIGASYGSTSSLPINVSSDSVLVKKITSTSELTDDPILYIL